MKKIHSILSAALLASMDSTHVLAESAPPIVTGAGEKEETFFL